MIAIWIALAGGAGAALRSVVDVLVARVSSQLPWATFVVNISGSLALGWLIGSAANHDLTLIAGTGFLGGYTTFSSASLQAAQAAIEDHRHLKALGLAVAMVVTSVAAAALGVQLA